jgi:tetratricopeptide (TPR) repeat protein
LRRAERDGLGFEANAVFIAPDVIVTGHRLAVSEDDPKLLPWLRLRVDGSVHSARVTGYSHSWRLVALSVRGLRGDPAVGRPSRTLRLGETVTVVAAMDEELRSVDGEITGLTLMTKGRWPYERHYEIATSVPAWPESAGAGLFDVRGNVVGVCGEAPAGEALTAAPADRFAVGSGKHVARAHVAYGLFRDAARELRGMIEQDGQDADPEVWCMLAVCGEALGHAGEQREALRRACALDPENAWSAHALGAALLAAGERDAARPWLRRAVALEPWTSRYRLALEDAGR